MKTLKRKCLKSFLWTRAQRWCKTSQPPGQKFNWASIKIFMGPHFYTNNAACSFCASWSLLLLSSFYDSLCKFDNLKHRVSLTCFRVGPGLRAMTEIILVETQFQWIKCIHGQCGTMLHRLACPAWHPEHLTSITICRFHSRRILNFVKCKWLPPLQFWMGS